MGEMSELMGTLRLVRRGKTDDYADLEAVGSITSTIRYRLHEDTGLVDVLDEIALPYVEGAEGFALYADSGELLGWLPVVAESPTSEIRFRGGWSFRDFAAARGRERAAART